MEIRKELAKVSGCDCKVVDGELERCSSHQEAYEVGRKLAHLPD